MFNCPQITGRALPGLLSLLALVGLACGEDPEIPTEGFGTSGLLFNNNLVMYDRSQSNGRDRDDLVLYPQMYFMDVRQEGYPVLGSFPEDLLVGGGPGVDGIPAILKPEWVGAGAVDYLAEDDLVLGVALDGEARAYPELLLWWHEIVNDRWGERTLAVTLCPLTGTGMVFDISRIQTRLELLPVVETTWGTWKRLHPGTRVMTRKTGFEDKYEKRYGLYPYGTYRSPDSPPLFDLTRPLDRRFSPKHRVLGLAMDEVRKAYPFSRLAERVVVNDEVGGHPVAVFFDPGSETAIPFSPRVGEQILTFETAPDINGMPAFVDMETGTSWNLKGEALSGPLAGKGLEQLPSHVAYWFAWAVFWPETGVLGEEGGPSGP